MNGLKLTLKVIWGVGSIIGQATPNIMETSITFDIFNISKTKTALKNSVFFQSISILERYFNLS